MIFSVLFASMLVIHCVSSPVSAVLQGAVLIHNEMRNHQSIHANCESFGEKTIVYGDPFEWGFRHGGRGTSQGAYIRCGFTWGRRVQNFIVWAGDGVSVPYAKCERCLWRVGAGGFYVNEAGLPGNAAVFVYPWLPGP